MSAPVKVDEQTIEFVIDSGASVNLIVKILWSELKMNKIKCTSETTDKKSFLYGSTVPFKLVGKFKTCVEHAGKRLPETEFFVLDGSGQPLFGKEASTKLGLLKLNHKINWVNNNEFQDCFEGIEKLKNFSLKIHIDKEVKPVTQTITVYHLVCRKE